MPIDIEKLTLDNKFQMGTHYVFIYDYDEYGPPLRPRRIHVTVKGSAKEERAIEEIKKGNFMEM